MSYISTILSDYPLAYYPLDDMTTADNILDFTDLLSQFNTYQDVLDNFSSYANMYGDIAYDYSGCNNNGNYIGDPAPNILPIIAANSRSTKITSTNHIEYKIDKDYSNVPNSAHFGKQNLSDASFTLEFWFYPEIYNNEITPILADSDSLVGVFFDNGNILFKLNTEELYWTIPHLKQVIHVACVYTQATMSIYIDGQLKTIKNLSEFTFTNSDLNLQSGPTFSSDYFLINSVAVYRYALNSNQIAYHNVQAKGLSPIQIVSPDNGELFEIWDDDISTIFKYSYPANKNWTTFLTDDLYYNPIENSLQLKSGTVSEVILEDFISIPGTIDLNSSKIEWNGDNGISIQISTDGITYNDCVNGEPIPGYTLESFDINRKVYLKIIFSSSFPDRCLPKLFNIVMSFYNNQILYSSNGTSYLEAYEQSKIGLGRFKTSILDKNTLNGLKVLEGSSFKINTTNNIYTVEFFYEPDSLLANGLIYSDNVYYTWDSSGLISTNNISAIYVNNQDKTLETDINNVFSANGLYHIVLVFTEAQTNSILFNASQLGSTRGRYQNIALYDYQFIYQNVLNHYSLYIYRDINAITSSLIPLVTMTENALNYYDSQWTVIQTA